MQDEYEIADILKNIYEGFQGLVNLVVIMLQLAAALCKDFIKTPWTFVAADDVRLSRTNNSEDPTDEDNMRTAENKSRTELESDEAPTQSSEYENIGDIQTAVTSPSN